jgi:hypothetical protein
MLANPLVLRDSITDLDKPQIPPRSINKVCLTLRSILLEKNN